MSQDVYLLYFIAVYMLYIEVKLLNFLLSNFLAIYEVSPVQINIALLPRPLFLLPEVSVLMSTISFVASYVDRFSMLWVPRSTGDYLSGSPIKLVIFSTNCSFKAVFDVLSLYLPPPRRFVFGSSLLVCLSVCQEDYRKTTGFIFMILGWRV